MRGSLSLDLAARVGRDHTDVSEEAAELLRGPARGTMDASAVGPGRRIAMQRVEIGYQTFVADGDAEFGAVREVSRDGLVVYVENAGDFSVPWDAVRDVHYQKVILDCEKLDPRLRTAIGHAHDAEARDA